MSIRNLIEDELPLNRKEGFFTNTVFPMIVCRDNFKYLTLFTSLFEGCEGLEVIANPDSANIQFFTEYSLLESIYTDRAKRRFTNAPKIKDAPDIIILIKGETKILIAIAAKMYDTPNNESLINQLNNQKRHIDYLVEKLNIDRAIQCILLPEKICSQIGNLGTQIITWETIHNTYEHVLHDDYFLDLLKISLDSYDELVAERRQYGKHSEKKMLGEDIYDKFKLRQLDMVIMGRYMGLKGDYLLNDIQSGLWKKQEYETSSAGMPFNDSWFHIEDFVELVNRIGH
ncbi:hypothetical protein ACFLWZ_07845 [Chloroflexota bacterium]